METYNQADYPTSFTTRDIARHFAEWGYLRAAEKYNEIEYNRQRVVEGKIIFLLNGDVAVNIGDTDEYKLGQKVRVIIVKE